MRLTEAPCFNFFLNGLRQLFAEFDAHLIKGVDVPDRSLNENLVFVEGDQTP